MTLIDKRGETVGSVPLGSPSAGRSEADDNGFPVSMLRAALSGKVSGSGRFTTESGQGDGSAVLGAYAPVPGTDWTVLSRQPAEIAEATAVQLRRRGLLATGLAALLCFLAVALAQRSVVLPIRELIAAQHRLAGSEGVPAAAMGGEIAQLKASFRLLQQRLQERQALDEVFLGRYQVQQVVGEGAMGTVFRGWDPALQRPVALKTVRFDSPERGEQAQSLLQEAVAVARFNHPNIVGIYDVQESPEVAFLSMEFIDGESLDHYLARHPDLDIRETVLLGLGIARGLAAAHSRGILHRDIKPANVLLSHEGEIKIADFGISQSLASLGDEDDMVFGTPGFIPPETLTGQGYSPAGDLFALGATLYRLLIGRLPFTGKNLTAMIHNTVSEPLVRPKALVAGIPEALDTLVVELLDKERDRRPHADEVVLRLEALAEELEGFGGSGSAWQPRPQGSEADDLARQPTSLLTRTRPGHSFG
jgi:predicted Ser/Thr protein kinase